MSGVTIEDQRRVVPNQGIRRSALNGLVLGLICVVIVGLLYMLSFELSMALSTVLYFGPYVQGTGLYNELSYQLSNWLGVGVRAGLPAGVLVGLLNGGLASFRHYVLRFLLWRSWSMPWNYPRFLDDAAERILLRKVGGGYIFVHRLLLEYFASLDSTPIQDEARAHKQRVLPVS